MAVVGFHRRQVLQNLGVAALSSLVGNKSLAAQAESYRFLTAFQKSDGTFHAGVIDASGTISASVSLPVRGHEVIHQPNGGGFEDLAIVFARRPGTIAVQFNTKSGQATRVFHCPNNRHFYGHGVFCPKGALLFTTENDFENASGVIGVYEAKNGFRRIGEFSSGGVGPHDIGIDAVGKRLVVANGGIETHPEYGRTKLNLASMRSNLSVFDLKTFDLLSTFETPKSAQKISLRHFVLNRKGEVWLAGQNQDQNDYSLPLLWCWSETDGLRSAEVPDDHNRLLDGYIGSIAYNSDHDLLAVSSPKSGHVVVVRTRDLSVAHSKGIASACGLAAEGKGFLVSTLEGGLDRQSKPQRNSGVHWDNHMERVLVHH